MGHQHASAGERYLEYLKENGQENSGQHQITQKVIDQGKYYYDHSDSVCRENMMTENFIREYDRLSNESIMGIYGDISHGENLTPTVKESNPVRTDQITVKGKVYEASCYGKQDLTGFKDQLLFTAPVS